MSALIRHLALVSESSKVNIQEVTVVSAALQKQIVRDVAPIWEISATVDPFTRLEDVPLGYWPMIVKDDIGMNAGGVHMDRNGQPYALITASNNNDAWSIIASHEALEMLVDPFGNRQVAGDSPKADQGRVLFLVEVCDPSEAAQFGYSVNGVLVADFYTPRYFDPVASSSVRYSYTNAITSPRQVLLGGYLSWLEPVSGHWWQEIWFGTSQASFRDLGVLTAENGSMRSQIDRMTNQETHEAVEPGRSAALVAGLPRADLDVSTTAMAVALHQQIGEIEGGNTRRTRSNRRNAPRISEPDQRE